MGGSKFELEYGVLDGYEVRSYFDMDDGFYVAVIDILPGCATDGATREEALEKLKAVKSEWITVMCAMGKPIPKPQHEPGCVMA